MTWRFLNRTYCSKGCPVGHSTDFAPSVTTYGAPRPSLTQLGRHRLGGKGTDRIGYFVLVLITFLLLFALAGTANGAVRHQGAAQVPQGGSASFASTGTELPDNGRHWDIKDPSGAVIAHEQDPGGWSVSWSGSEFTVGAPSSAAVGSGYKVRLRSGSESSALSESGAFVDLDLEAASAEALPSGSSAVFAVTSGQPPGGSGGLGLTAGAGNTQVSLQWTADPYDHLNEYAVYESTNPNLGWTLVTEVTDQYTYTVTGLTNGTTYYFYVAGSSLESGVLSATPLAPPAGLVASAGVGQVGLSWTAGAGDATYNVYDSTTSGGPYTQVASGVTATNYTVTGLTNATTYYFIVSSWNVSSSYTPGTGGNSNQAYATPGVPTPTNLSATPGNQLVSLSWTGAAGETYNILRSTTSGSGYTTIATGVNLTIYGDSSAADGTTYYYVVTASEDGVTSGNSNQVNATPYANGDILMAVGAGTQINLSWTQAPGEEGYILYRSLSPFGGFTMLVGLSSTATSYSDTTAQPNTDYWYELTASGSTGTPYNVAEASTASNTYGFYNVTYSGGNSNNGVPWQLGTCNVGSSQNLMIIPDIFCLSGSQGAPEGGQCSGPISAYFTWQGGGDPPPQVAVNVFSQEVAACDSWSYLDADDGFGLAESGYSSSDYLEVGEGNYYGAACLHTYYIQNPGPFFTIPDAFPIAAAGTPDSTGAWFSAAYAAMAYQVTPPTITVGGFNPTGNAFIIGQQLTATINLVGTGLTASPNDTYTWTVSGAGPVANYTMNASGATITPLTASVPPPAMGTYLTQSELACYLTQASQSGTTSVTVGCIYKNSKSGLTFKNIAPVTVGVVAPTDSPQGMMYSNSGTMQLVAGIGDSLGVASSGTTATGMTLYGSTFTATDSSGKSTTRTSGVFVCDEVKDPSWVGTGNNGTWEYVQTVDGVQSSDAWTPTQGGSTYYRMVFEGNTYGPVSTLDGYPVAGAGPGTFPMDNLFAANAFPYSAAPIEPGAPGATQPELGGMSDGPGVGVFPISTVPGELITFQGTFHSFVLYQPPPNSNGTKSIQVPIVRYDWTINPTSTTYSASSGWGAPTPTPPATSTVVFWSPQKGPLDSTTFPIPTWSLPPATLTASGAGVTPVQLSWPVSSGAKVSDFWVYRAQGSGPFLLLASAGLSIPSGGTTATYTDSTATTGTGPYYYFVMGKWGYVGYTLGANGLPVMVSP